MIEVKFKKLVKEAVIPIKRNGDACYDVVATSINITSQYIEYGLGFATEYPENVVGEIFPRSSISNYDLVLANSVPQMDSIYRGEWKVRFKATLPTEVIMDIMNPTVAEKYKDWKPKIYEVGDKVAQIRFSYIEEAAFIDSEELSDSERGSGGFGSTGK